MSEEIKELLFLLHNDRLTKTGKRKIEQEIERLNNIINELEKWLYERSEYTNFGVVIDKLQELKHKKIYGSVDSEIIYFDEVGSDKE